MFQHRAHHLLKWASIKGKNMLHILFFNSSPYENRKSLYSGFNWGTAKIMRCPHYQCAVPVRRSCHLPAIFPNLSYCGVKQNCRGHDAHKSLRWLQALSVVAAWKGWFEHLMGIVNSSKGKCNKGIIRSLCYLFLSGRFTQILLNISICTFKIVKWVSFNFNSSPISLTSVSLSNIMYCI